jgi:nitrogen PTS system EIIA component
MILQEAFKPSTIKADLESESKDELFEELVDLLANSCPPRQNFPRQEVLEALYSREAKMSTGICKGIALPHATVPGLDSLKGAIGISRKGIDYDALDGHPVYLVFLLLTPPDDAESHLHALQRLAALIEDKAVVQKLSSATTPEAAFSIIKEFEHYDAV